MQKDLDDSFARSLREANLKKQCNEMQRLRSLFDNAFTPDQFHIVQTQKELSLANNQTSKYSQNSNDHFLEIGAKTVNSRPSPRHAASPNCNMVTQKQKCCHLDKHRVYQLQRQGTICPHLSSSKSVTSLGQLSSKQESRPTSALSHQNSQAFITPRRVKPGLGAQNSEKKLSKMQMEDGYNARSTPNLVRHKTLISQTANTSSQKRMYASKMETPKRKPVVPSVDKTPLRKTPTMLSSSSKTPQRKIPTLSASKPLLKKSTNVTPSHRSGATKMLKQDSSMNQTPRKTSQVSSVSKASLQKAKAISLVDAKGQKNGTTPQRNKVNAQRVQQIRMKYTMNDSRNSNVKQNNQTLGTKSNKLLMKSSEINKLEVSSKMSSNRLDTTSRLNSSMTKNTARQTPSAAFQQSSVMKASKIGPGKTFESPRSQDSSKLFEFSSQNIVSKAGSTSQMNGGQSVRTNVPRSLNNLGRVVKNEKKIQTSRPEQSGQFTKDFQKLNLIAIQSAKARNDKTTGSSSQSWSTRGLAKTKTLQGSQSSDSKFGKKPIKIENQPNTREQTSKLEENRKRLKVGDNDKSKMSRYQNMLNSSGSTDKKVGTKFLKQSDRSVNSRIGCGVLNDHGSTEVTTIESYDLTSAMELNLNSAMSREIEDSEGLRVAGDSLKKQGAQENQDTGKGDIQNQSQVFPSNHVDYKDSQMFELVQFFNIKDISQFVPKTEHKIEESTQQVDQNDSFESSDVSYARASVTHEGDGDQSSDDLDRAVPENITKEQAINDNVKLSEDALIRENQLQSSVDEHQQNTSESSIEELSPEMKKTIEDCIRKGLSEQLEEILLEVRRQTVQNNLKGPIDMTEQRFQRIINEFDSDLFTMDELKEVFALHGESRHLQQPSELLALVDHYLPEQSGYGVFRKATLICVGLLWCSGLDLLAGAEVAGKEIVIHCDSESETRGLMRPSGVVEEVIDEDDEPSQLSIDACPPLDNQDIDETSRQFKDQIYCVAHEEAGSGESHQSSQIVDDQALFWDILNEQ